MKTVMMGTEAAAMAVKLARVEVVSAYPITPQTIIVESLADIIGRGELKAKYLPVESEHTAMSSCMGASMVGARVFTATSSQGLAYMHEMLHFTAGERVPIVMVNCNRAMAPPWNLYCDHTDSLSQRDTGWIQYYCADAQDVLDAILIAYAVAEQTLLPVMINLDAFYLTHTSEPLDVPDQAAVDLFLPPIRHRSSWMWMIPRPSALYAGQTSSALSNTNASATPLRLQGSGIRLPKNTTAISADCTRPWTHIERRMPTYASSASVRPPVPFGWRSTGCGKRD